MRKYFSQGKGAALTADGAAAGLITIASTTGFFAGATAWVGADNVEPFRVEITEIVDATKLRVRKTWNAESGFGVRNDNSFANVAVLTVAANARIDMEPQLVADPTQSA